MMNPVCYFSGLVLLGCLITLGCHNRQPEPFPVSGTVEYQGKPLTHGDVVFVPALLETGPMARGKIDQDGRFVLTTLHEGDGTLPGDYKVTVFQTEPIRQLPGMAAPAVGRSMIPTRYNDARSTDLLQTVGKLGAEVVLVLVN